MLYKEFLSARLKYSMIAVMNLLLGGAIIGLHVLIYGVNEAYNRANALENGYHYYGITSISVFNVWMVYGIFITIGAAILGGIEIISDEVDKGTLSFLLSHPISRGQVYQSKIGVNLIALLIICGLSHGLMLGINQLFFRPERLPEAFANIGLVLAVAALVLCLAGVVSIYTRQILHTLVVTLGIMLIGGALLRFLSNWNISNSQFLTLPSVLESYSLVLGTLILTVLAGFAALGLFLLGRKLFLHKSF